MTRPEVAIKVFPENYFAQNKLQVLHRLKKTNALILKLEENIKGNVFNTPYPYVTFRRISSSEKLPDNLKMDGDPLSDFFISLQTLRSNYGEVSRSDSGGSGKNKSSFLTISD